MIDEIGSMNREEIDSLSNEEVLQLGAPVRSATSNTFYFDDETLKQLAGFFQRLDENFASLTDTEHSIISNRIEDVLNSSTESDNSTRGRGVDEIREILKNWASDTDESPACGDLFNTLGNFVMIGTGESFNQRNF
jgi:hypothetical protein